jgi:hypothetical protein
VRCAALSTYEAQLIDTLYLDDFSVHRSIYKRRKIDFHTSGTQNQSTSTQCSSVDKATQTETVKIPMDDAQQLIA